MLSVSSVSSDRIEQIKRAFSSEGIFVEKGGELMWVDLIYASQKRPLFQDYSQYGIQLLSPKSEEDELEEPIEFPEQETYVEKGDRVLAVGYSSSQQAVIHSEAVVTEDFEDDCTFAIQAEEGFDPPLYSVFSLNQESSSLNLVGIFSSCLGKVVHVEGFEEETRGKQVLECEGFEGSELRKPGKGPRSLLICRKDVGQISYCLQVWDHNSWRNPHHERKYNKGQGSLYKIALEAFVEHYKKDKKIPGSFEFTSQSKSTYLATLL